MTTALTVGEAIDALAKFDRSLPIAHVYDGRGPLLGFITSGNTRDEVVLIAMHIGDGVVPVDFDPDERVTSAERVQTPCSVCRHVDHGTGPCDHRVPSWGLERCVCRGPESVICQKTAPARTPSPSSSDGTTTRRGGLTCGP